jgi:hypothetical protein
MQTKYHLKNWLKIQRWRLRRSAVALRWGPRTLDNTPSVLGNAMPKSGSHLIFQVVKGLTQLGPFVNPGMPPVNRAEDNHKLSQDEIVANLKRMRPGDIGYGYLHANEPYLTLLTAPARATIFVYRDPRDMIISHVFYATQMHRRHAMHRYYNDVLGTMEDRINAAILGVDQPEVTLSPIRQKYEHYLGWLDQPDVLCLRFEQLILDRDMALAQLLDYLRTRGFQPKLSRQANLDTLKEAIIPKRSGTFRKAQPGNWREHFTPGNKTLFKQSTGDLLVRLGYEENDRW